MTAITRLTGRTAIITSATSGIGLASVERFIEEGATVFAVARGAERLDALASRLGQSLSRLSATSLAKTTSTGSSRP